MNTLIKLAVSTKSVVKVFQLSEGVVRQIKFQEKFNKGKPRDLGNFLICVQMNL